MSYLSETDLLSLRLKSFGKNVKISVDARIYGANRVSIGDNVRIDAFSILATGDNGYINIGSHIHIATNVALYGGGGITIGDFCTISSKCTLYSSSDDYSGEFLIGPQIDEKFLKLNNSPIIMNDYSAIGAHSLVLPGVQFGYGAVLGSMSLATRDLDAWLIYAGSPCKFIKTRKQDLIERARQFKEKYEH